MEKEQRVALIAEFLQDAEQRQRQQAGQPEVASGHAESALAGPARIFGVNSGSFPLDPECLDKVLDRFQSTARQDVVAVLENQVPRHNDLEQLPNSPLLGQLRNRRAILDSLKRKYDWRKALRLSADIISEHEYTKDDLGSAWQEVETSFEIEGVETSCYEPHHGMCYKDVSDYAGCKLFLQWIRNVLIVEMREPMFLLFYDSIKEMDPSLIKQLCGFYF